MTEQGKLGVPIPSSIAELKHNYSGVSEYRTLDYQNLSKAGLYWLKLL